MATASRAKLLNFERMPYADHLWWSDTKDTIGRQPNPAAPRCLPCNFTLAGIHLCDTAHFACLGLMLACSSLATDSLIYSVPAVSMIVQESALAHALCLLMPDRSTQKGPLTISPLHVKPPKVSTLDVACIRSGASHVSNSALHAA